MTEYPYLIITKSEFENRINELVSNGNSLRNIKVTNEEVFSKLQQQYTEWESRVVDLLNTSFSKEGNAFYDEFNEVGVEPSSYLTQIGQKQPLEYRGTILIRFLQSKIEYLKYNLRLILVCDFISTGDNSIKENRNFFSTQQKLSFLLDRLYQLNDGEYYPVEMLLKGNGLSLKYPQEARELVQMLEDNEYVTSLGGAGSEISARITSSGSMHYEETQTIQADTTTPEAEPKGQEDINKRVDSIIEYLNNLGLGQEILFEELQELKGLYSKLNKKNWLQVLKGKVLDIAVDKLTDIETIKLIYKKLTGDDLKLLS